MFIRNGDSRLTATSFHQGNPFSCRSIYFIRRINAAVTHSARFRRPF